MRERTEYLLALYIAEHREGAPVPTGTVAEMLDRTPGTATEMVRGLAEEGLATHEPYEGAALTEAGRERASDLHGTYVTLSWFFRSVLGLDEHETQAMELAGVIGPDVAKRLADALLAGDELPEGFGGPPGDPPQNGGE
jgi:DtxR family Mn-dependent transcriptional regulator